MVVFILRTFHPRTWLPQRSMSMMSVTRFCCARSPLSSHLPHFTSALVHPVRGRLPWKVTGVMLADTVEGYEAHKLQLISAFSEQHSLSLAEALHLPVSWKKRWKPRKFGNIFPGEVRTCQSIAQQTGIFLDPIYTLAGWEAATSLSLENDGEGQGCPTVVIQHTGGTFGLFVLN